STQLRQLRHETTSRRGVTDRRPSVTCFRDVSPRRFLLDASWLLIPPPHLRQWLLPRPHLVERLAFIQPPILHHVADLLRVVDVVQRIRIYCDQVGELPRLERDLVP